MSGSFKAPTPWSGDRPETLVICCSDGRWHAQTEEFARAEVSERPDLYAVPGGPAVVLANSSSYGEAHAFESALEVLAKHHDIHSVWLIAHQGCAYYRGAHPTLDADALRRRQLEDMRQAKRFLTERWRRWTIRMVFAQLQGNRVEFQTQDD